VSLAELIAAQLLVPGQELRLRGRSDMTAKVGSDGRLVVKGKSYGSPSTAANALLGGHSNGWVTWKVRVGSEWVVLDRLRQEATARVSRA
jgi:hypothetical protein